MAPYAHHPQDNLILLGHRMRLLSRSVPANDPQLGNAIAAFARAKILLENARAEPKLRQLVCHCEAFDRYREKVIAAGVAWAAAKRRAAMEIERQMEEENRDAANAPAGGVQVTSSEVRVVKGQTIKVETREPVVGFASDDLEDDTDTEAEEEMQVGMHRNLLPERVDEGYAVVETTTEAKSKDHEKPQRDMTMGFEMNIHPALRTHHRNSDLRKKNLQDKLIGLGVTCLDEADDEQEDGDDDISAEDDKYSSDESWDSDETSCTEEGCGCDGDDGQHQPMCKFEEGSKGVPQRSSPKLMDTLSDSEEDDDDDEYDSDFEEMTAEMQSFVIAIPWQAK